MSDKAKTGRPPKGEEASPEPGTLGYRLREARESARFKITAWAKEIGLDTTTVRNYELNKRQPPADYLGLTAQKTGKSVDWLLSGFRFDDHLPPDPPGIIGVPMLGLALAAGGGALALTERVERYIYFDEEWLWRTYRVRARELVLFEVLGDSMEPLFRSGEWVLIERGEQGRQLGDGIYAIRLGDDLLLKRLQRLPEGRVRVSSINEIYSPFELQLDDGNGFQIIGRAVINLRRL